MAISVTDPISYAFERTGQILFKPFNAGKWFTLGFCAWLSMLGEGGAGNFQVPGGGPGGGGPLPGPGGPGRRQPPPQTFPEVVDEMKGLFLQHAYWIIPALLLLLLIVLAVMWVRARGKFLFLEGVAYDRAAVVEPWKRLRPLANSYFRFAVALAFTGFLALAGLGTVLFLVALPDIRAEQISGPTIAALVVGGLLLIGGLIAYAVVAAIVEDFVLPLMYLRGKRVGAAWREFRADVLRGNAGSFVLFYLMRLVLGMGAGVIMLLGTCITCCIAALPYVYAVVFLPVFVFTRAYSLYFLRQFGPQYNLVMDIYRPPVGAFQVVMPPAPPEGGGWQNDVPRQ